MTALDGVGSQGSPLKSSLRKQGAAAPLPQRRGSSSSGAEPRPHTAPESSQQDDLLQGSLRRSCTFADFPSTDEVSCTRQLAPSPSHLLSSTLRAPRSSRFSPEEVKCLRRIPKPSTDCEAKLETYFQSFVKPVPEASLESSQSLPVLKGKFFEGRANRSSVASSHSSKSKDTFKDTAQPAPGQPLPEESLNASVLDVIYPRVPPGLVGKGEIWVSAASGAESEQCQDQDDYKGVTGAMQAGGSTLAVPSGNVVKTASNGGTSRHGSSLNHLGNINRSPRQLRSSISVPGRGKQPSAGSGTLLSFRAWLREHFPTLEDAYASFSKDVGGTQITKKDWRRVLSKLFSETGTHRKDCDGIFEQLDYRSLGVITVNEFVIAVEAASPVRTVEDLRRRWLASGFTSMNQAIRKMDNEGAMTTQRLHFEEFGRLLATVNVCDRSEQVALFGLVCSDPDGTTSVGELASAVAAVSPSLLLEDIRERLLRKYNGNLDKAFSDFDMNRCGRVNRQEFTLKAIRTLGFTDLEAKKAFREIEYSGSGEVSRVEFLGAMGICEPSHMLEDLRLKVRHRFRNMRSIFAKAFEESMTDELSLIPRLPLSKVRDLLQPLDFSDQEIRLLFIIMDRNQSGDLSVFEFTKSIRQFAPACMLEDLRAIVCHRYQQVREAFSSTEDRFKLLDIDALNKLLRSLRLLDPDATTMEGHQRVRTADFFSIVDVRHEGKATVDRLVAALQSCSSSSSVGLPPEELDLRAKQDVRGDMAPVHRLIHTLKDQVRQGKDWLDDRTKQATMDPNALDVEALSDFPETVRQCVKWGMEEMKSKTSGSRKQRSKAWAEEPVPKSRSEPNLLAPASRRRSVSQAGAGEAEAEGGEGEEEAAAGESSLENATIIKTPTKSMKQSSKRDAEHIPRITSRNVDIRKPSTKAVPAAQQAWGSVWKSLHNSPGHQQRARLERQVQTYFQTATSSLARDAPLLQGDCFSRTALHANSITRKEAMKENRSRSCP